jgi:hypothetical protein
MLKNANTKAELAVLFGNYSDYHGNTYLQSLFTKRKEQLS